MSVFISFEGGEGSGKTTQAKRLEERLNSDGYDVLRVHEPGGTPFGDQIRSLLLDWSSKSDNAIDFRAQVLGFCTARAQLVSKVIAPRLNQTNTITITDRYGDSTIAYQIFGAKNDGELEAVQALLNYATRGIWPKLTFYLDVSVETGMNRVLGRIKRSQHDKGQYQYEDTKQFSFLEENYFELQNREYHERVRKGYEWLITNEPKRWSRIDASLNEEHVFLQIYSRTLEFLKKKRINPANTV